MSADDDDAVTVIHACYLRGLGRLQSNISLSSGAHAQAMHIRSHNRDHPKRTSTLRQPHLTPSLTRGHHSSRANNMVRPTPSKEQRALRVLFVSGPTLDVRHHQRARSTRRCAATTLSCQLDRMMSNCTASARLLRSPQLLRRDIDNITHAPECQHSSQLVTIVHTCFHLALKRALMELSRRGGGGTAPTVQNQHAPLWHPQHSPIGL